MGPHFPSPKVMIIVTALVVIVAIVGILTLFVPTNKLDITDWGRSGTYGHVFLDTTNRDGFMYLYIEKQAILICAERTAQSQVVAPQTTITLKNGNVDIYEGFVGYAGAMYKVFERKAFKAPKAFPLAFYNTGEAYTEPYERFPICLAVYYSDRHSVDYLNSSITASRSIVVDDSITFTVEDGDVVFDLDMNLIASTSTLYTDMVNNQELISDP